MMELMKNRYILCKLGYSCIEPENLLFNLKKYKILCIYKTNCEKI